ncbi:MAG: hypothetical protein Kow00128_16370 [Deltaproteobacteria bacterium]
MTVSVLASESQIREARARMRARGIDCASTFLERFLYRIGISDRVPVGDRRKSWDVLKTISFLQEFLSPDDPILDIGAHSCEILPILHRLGYTNLTGVDLDPEVGKMPHADRIRYIRSDFREVPCGERAFACVTAVSVIEHGFEADRLLSELDRILRPGGYFLASVDYWPEKIDTGGIRAYGMDWTIFSREELERFLANAERYGFSCVGPRRFEASERVISWMGKRYTFAWMALRKASGPTGQT